ncbi:MAG: ArsR/SmtB family transcription factor [Candidatus Helarchaeota archaeon]
MLRLNDQIVEFFKAFAEPTRLEIIELLKDGERCACEIHPILPRTQSTISLHLKKLVNANILSVRQVGTRKLYSIKDEQVFQIFLSVKALISKWNEAQARHLLNLTV